MYAEEAFGPTVGVLEVESEEEAVRVANDTGYGLSAAVFTEDLRRGFRVARQIDSGYVALFPYASSLSSSLSGLASGFAFASDSLPLLTKFSFLFF